MFEFFLKKDFNEKTPIFVIGSGRSGTHLLGRVFLSSPEVRVFIEDPKFFKKVTEFATGQVTGQKALKRIMDNYKKEFSKVKEKFILEKTHPNIWLFEYLVENFPNAKFIGIYRDVYPTVASMLQHKGVMKWYDVLPLNKVNNFLGINENNINVFQSLSIEAKCALRWKAHKERLLFLSKKYNEKILVINYESFYSNSALLLKKIVDFVQLDTMLQVEELKDGGMDKWKDFLNEKQIANINEAINKH
jgi:hypothetical protein